MIFERLWNWKKHPASVWYVAGPLAVLGLSVHLLRALIALRQNGDPWFLVIWLASIALLVFALWPVRKYLIGSNA